LIKLAILGTRGIPARYGGFETFAEEVSTRLAERGVDVTVFCPADSPREDETYRGITLKYVLSPKLGPFNEVLWDAKCFYIARRNFDIVYMLGVGGVFAAWIPRLFGSAVWVNTDGMEWKRTKFSLPQRAYLAFAEALSTVFASRVIADSAAIAAYLCRRYPRLNKVSNIAYGAEIPSKPPDPELLNEWGLQLNDYYIVVCRLEPENHVLEIVEGFEQSQSQLPLIVLGNIANPNAYVQKLLARRSPRIRFIGTVYDKAGLAALRYYARAYLHGHSVGGTNPSLLEAMSCSNLVVAHDNPFNREVLGKSGLFFAKPEEIAAWIDAIDRGQVDVNGLREGVLERIRSTYDWDRIADEYLELLSHTESVTVSHNRAVY
jgi:glycosyltransferase involved in cell wall biosynthesis